MNIPRAIQEGIEKGTRFVVSTHSNPDADGVGAAVAFSWLLWKLGKSAQIVYADRLGNNFRFLENLFEVSHRVTPSALKADTWAVLDASGFHRTGLKADLKDKPVINIDHHQDNEMFGRYNWVDPAAPAVSEMIFHLIKAYGFSPDKEIAEALYTGILIDTGGFQFSNTGTRVFQACADLAACGIDCQHLYRRVFLDKSVSRTKLEGLILSRAQLLHSNKVCVMEVTDRAIKDTHAKPSDLEGISNLPLGIRGIRLGILFIEKGKRTKICFRSDGSNDVGKLASYFGGGGHAAASGCTLDGAYPAIRRKVLEKVSKYFTNGSHGRNSGGR